MGRSLQGEAAVRGLSKPKEGKDSEGAEKETEGAEKETEGAADETR